MKKIIFFICFSFVFLFCGLTCLVVPTSFSFAEGGDDIKVLNISALLQSSKTQSFQSSYKIDEEGYVSKTVKILKEDGTEFLLLEEEPETPTPEEPEEPAPEADGFEVYEEGEVISVVDPSDLPANLDAIRFSDSYFSVTKKAELLETVVSLKYQVVFTLEDSSTVTKTADIQVVFHNFNIYLLDDGEGSEIYEVGCDLNVPQTSESFKQYIDTTKTNVNLEEITTKFSGVDFYQIGSGVVVFTFQKTGYEIDGKLVDIKIEKYLSINVGYPTGWEGLVLEIYNGETYGSILDLGEVEYQKDWQYSGILKANIKGASFSSTNTQNFRVEVEETADFGVYEFIIYSKTIIEGQQVIDINAMFDTYTSDPATLQLEFKISSTPTINLSSKTLTIDKGRTYGEVREVIENNIALVYEVLGDLVDNDLVVINDETLSSLYNTSDVVGCGEYVVTYTYTSTIVTGRVCATTEEIVVSVVNSKPEINNVVVKVDETGIANNSRVYINKDMVVEMSATDINKDAIIFVLRLTNEADVVSNNAATVIIKNSNTQYTISADLVDNTSTINFTIKAPQNYFGNFGFEVVAYDDGNAENGDTFDFNVEYYETGIPVIVLLTTGMIWDPDEEIYYTSFEQEFTSRNLLTKYVYRVEDDFDTSVTTAKLKIEVVKEGVKQQMVGTTFTFSEVGIYYINYSVSDVSNNTTSTSIKFIVTEVPNSTPTISPYILDLNEAMEKDFSYKDTVAIDIDEYFTIIDENAKCKNCNQMILTGSTTCPNCNQPHNADELDILTYYNEIGAFVAADTTSTKILCTNSESFSWGNDYKVLTFKQDPSAYYVGTVYLAIYVDDNTGLATGISAPAFIKITFVNNVPPTVTQNNAKTTYIIGRDDFSAFDKTAYFTATHDFDKTTITPVVNILDENNNQVINIDFTKVGTYTLNYYFRYEQGGVEHTIQRSVTIKVTTGGIPTIVLKQESLQITVGNDFDISTIILQIEDAEDGNATYETLKDKITIEGLPENYSTPGEYKITIKYTDNDNNTTEKIFTLKIVEQSMLWIYIVIGVAGVAVLGGIIVLIIFISRRRYTRI